MKAPLLMPALAAGLAAGAVGFALALAGPAPARAWQAAFVNLLFFGGSAQAAVTLAAVFRLTRAAWAAPLLRLAESGVVFALAAPVGLVVLLLGGGEAVMPWLAHPRPELGGWLDRGNVIGREVLAWAAIGAAAALFVAASHRRDGKHLDLLATVLVLTYVLGLSLTAFDLIMTLEPGWRSALLGGYLLMSTLYLGTAGLVLAVGVAARPFGLDRALDPDRLQDLGRLMTALALFTLFLVYGQFLPIWYGNLREETGFVLARLDAPPWRAVALAVLAAAYLGPVLILLAPGAKRRREPLAAAALLAAGGLWLERWLLIGPSVRKGPGDWFGPPEAAVTAGFAAAFIGSSLLFLRRWPVAAAGDPLLDEGAGTGP